VNGEVQGKGKGSSRCSRGSWLSCSETGCCLRFISREQRAPYIPEGSGTEFREINDGVPNGISGDKQWFLNIKNNREETRR
jgi:hypothetical protein